MAELKSLAKDTAIYGASSIIGKFLNYFLVPIYTFSLPAASGGYGVITKMYAIVALLLVVLTFGWKPAFSVLPIKEMTTRRRYILFRY